MESESIQVATTSFKESFVTIRRSQDTKLQSTGTTMESSRTIRGMGSGNIFGSMEKATRVNGRTESRVALESGSLEKEIATLAHG